MACDGALTVLGDARGYGKRAAATAAALEWLSTETGAPATYLEDNAAAAAAEGGRGGRGGGAVIERANFHARPDVVQSVGTTINGYLRGAAAAVPVDSEAWVKGALAAWRASMKACTPTSN